MLNPQDWSKYIVQNRCKMRRMRQQCPGNHMNVSIHIRDSVDQQYPEMYGGELTSEFVQSQCSFKAQYYHSKYNHQNIYLEFQIARLCKTPSVLAHVSIRRIFVLSCLHKKLDNGLGKGGNFDL